MHTKVDRELDLVEEPDDPFDHFCRSTRASDRLGRAQILVRLHVRVVVSRSAVADGVDDLQQLGVPHKPRLRIAWLLSARRRLRREHPRRECSADEVSLGRGRESVGDERGADRLRVKNFSVFTKC